MFFFLKQLIRTNFAKNVFAVAGGAVLAQFVALLFSPLLTRFFGPEAIGILSLFVALTTVFGQIATLTYHNAIPLARSDSEIVSLEKLSFGATVTVFLATSFLMMSIYFICDKTSGEVSFLRTYWLLPVAFLFIGWSNSISQVLISKGRFSGISKIGVIHSTINGVLSLIAGAIWSTSISLLIANATSHFLRWLMLSIIRRGLTTVTVHTKSTPLSVAIKHKDFVLFRAPQEIISAASMSLPLIILGGQYGAVVVGLYGLAMRVLSVPSLIIGQSLGTVFYPRICQSVERGENVQKLIMKMTAVLALGGAVPYGIVIAFGPDIFEFVFGAQWRDCGGYAQWLALWNWCGLMNIGVAKSMPVCKLQKEFLIYEIVYLAIRVSSLGGGYAMGYGPLHSVMLFSLAGCTMNLLLITYVILKSGSLDENCSA